MLFCWELLETHILRMRQLLVLHDDDCVRDRAVKPWHEIFEMKFLPWKSLCSFKELERTNVPKVLLPKHWLGFLQIGLPYSEVIHRSSNMAINLNLEPFPLFSLKEMNWPHLTSNQSPVFKMLNVWMQIGLSNLSQNAITCILTNVKHRTCGLHLLFSPSLSCYQSYEI